MPRKSTEQQFDTLQAINEQAFVLFGRFGYEGVSVGDIAKAAKLSKGALYWHYHGKEALYLACLKRLHAIFNEYIFDPMRASDDPVARISAVFAGLHQLVQDPRVTQGVAGYWLVPSRPEMATLESAQREFEEQSIAAIEETLQRGTEQQRFDFGRDLQDMARAIMAIIEAIVLPLRHQSPEEVHLNLGVLARTLFRAYAKPEDLDALMQLI